MRVFLVEDVRLARSGNNAILGCGSRQLLPIFNCYDSFTLPGRVHNPSIRCKQNTY
jgi:hypothetical protein